jgi:hypothetical protein
VGENDKPMDGSIDGYIDGCVEGTVEGELEGLYDGRNDTILLLDGFAVGLLVFNGRVFFVNGDMDEAEDGCVAGSQELGSGFIQFGGVAGTH